MSVSVLSLLDNVYTVIPVSIKSLRRGKSKVYPKEGDIILLSRYDEQLFYFPGFLLFEYFEKGKRPVGFDLTLLSPANDSKSFLQGAHKRLCFEIPLQSKNPISDKKLQKMLRDFKPISRQEMVPVKDLRKLKSHYFLTHIFPTHEFEFKLGRGGDGVQSFVIKKVKRHCPNIPR